MSVNHQEPHRPPAVAQYGPAVMVTGEGIIDLYHVIGVGIRGLHHNGYPTSRFERQRQIFKQAYEFQTQMGVSASGLGDVAKQADLRQSRGDEPDDISTAEAAAISGYSRRHCQRLARDSRLGRRVGRSWVLDRVGFIAHLEAMKDGQPHDD